MAERGLSKEQRKYYALACVRKGARLPTRAECESYKAWWRGQEKWDWGKAQMREVIALCDATELTLPQKAKLIRSTPRRSLRGRTS
jgi:hypothetical protein